MPIKQQSSHFPPPQLWRSSRNKPKFGTMLKKELTRATTQVENEVFSKDALSLADLAPILRPYRQRFMLTYPLTRIISPSFTNNFFILKLEENQPFLDLLLTHSSIIGHLAIEIMIFHDQSACNLDLENLTMRPISSLLRPPPPTPMISLPNDSFTLITWNARGIGRPSFKENLNDIMYHYSLVVFILMETRTSAQITKNYQWPGFWKPCCCSLAGILWWYRFTLGSLEGYVL